MILKLYGYLLYIFIRNAVKFRLHFLFLISITAIYGILNGLFPVLATSALKHKSIASIMTLLIGRMLHNIYPQIKNILTYKTINSIIKDVKIYSVDTYIKSNSDNIENLGKIKRLPSHIYQLINSSSNILVYFVTLIIQIYFLRNFNILPLLIFSAIYFILFTLSIKHWIPMLKNSYTQDDNANFKAIATLEYKNQFANSPELLKHEVTSAINDEYHAYNKQTLYIRVCTLLTTLFLYSSYSIWIYLYFQTATLQVIISGVIFINCITKISNVFRLIIGLLYGMTLNFTNSSKPRNIQFDKITANNLSFQYDKPIFSNLSFQIIQNQWTRITGENGAGKTTLCKIISGILIPNNGVIQNGDFVLNQENQAIWKKHIIYKIKTLEIFEYELKQLKHNDQWLEFFKDYTYLLDQRKFSTGEKNFLSISAMIIYKTPWVVILDECLDCIDSSKRTLLTSFLKAHFSTLIFISQHENFQYDQTIIL